MSKRRFGWVVGAAIAFGALFVSSTAGATEVLTIGTLMPKSSPWGQVFTVWQKSVESKSGGKLELKFYYNGQQGDEAAMVAKVKAGQLDGAAVSSVGLSKIYRPVLALEMPGLFSSWAKLDAARDAMKGEFEKGIKDAGFTHVGWYDVGAVHAMSKGFAIRSPDDLKGKKPWMWRDDAAAPALFQTIGGVSPVPLNVPEVLPNLNTGAIDCMFAASLTAEQLQWSSKLDTIVDDVVSLQVAGIEVSSKRLDALPGDLKAILLDTGKVAAAALQKRIRSEDAAAYKRLSGKMTVVTLSAGEKTKWAGIYKLARKRLAQGTFSAALVAKLEGYAK